MSPTPPSPAPRWVSPGRVVAVLGVVVLLLVAHRLGLLQSFSDPARARQTLTALGPRGYVAFIAAYTLLHPIGIPGTLFIMVAPLIWPWPVAFVLSMTGTLAASVVGFSFARFVARDSVARRIPARFRRYEASLARRGFLTVFVLRLVFWMPQWLHALLGVSSVSFWTHFWGSLAGYLVPIFLVSYFGEQLFAALKKIPANAWLGIALVAMVVALSVWAIRRRRRDVAR